jgi:hypothetical protein
VDYLFCEITAYPELRPFASENRALIESRAKELSIDDILCWALTCAMYNFCYGRYVDSGGKIGMFSHPFLGYVRALREVATGRERASFLDSFKLKVGEKNVTPLLNLWLLGLYRPLPYTPDSKVMIDEIVSFRELVKSSSRYPKDSVPRNAANNDASVTAARGVAETFSVARFTEFFRGQPFSEGWTLGDALLMWHAMGHIALAVSASKAYGSDTIKISRVLQVCEPQLMKQWNLSEDEFKRFQAIVQQTEPEFLAAFEACESGDDLQCLASRYVDRIYGIPVPLSKRNKTTPLIDYLVIGIEPRAGMAFSHSVWQLFFSLVKSTVGVLKE